MTTGNDPIGKISPAISAYNLPAIDSATGQLPAVMAFLNSILRLVFIVAGLYGLINLIIAGFGFMTAGGDPKAITNAWNRIWQSLVGLLIIATSFLIAAIIGILLFGNPTAILQPKLQ